MEEMASTYARVAVNILNKQRVVLHFRGLGVGLATSHHIQYVTNCHKVSQTLTYFRAL